MTPGVRAILDALRFDRTTRALNGLTVDDLAFTDRAQLTPLLSSFELDAHVREHVDGALARNALRVARMSEAYRQIVTAFDHVVLKGFTHVPDFIGDPCLRVQYDLDLYVPPEKKEIARDALLKLGYVPIGGMEGLAMDHLPTMVRRTGWQWRGDYFDPDLPPAVEVHFRLWDSPTERLDVEGLDQFWDRREGNQLALVDRLGYAALHLTRHILRGNVRPSHVWEIARFLDTHQDAGFWRLWRELHSPSLRRIEAVGFLLAREWFACSLPEAAEAEIAALPARVHRWFEVFRWSPIEAYFKPNKHELWLHTSLLDSPSQRFDILRRRLIPASMPGPVDGIHVPKEEMTIVRRARMNVRNAAYAASRAGHHLRLFLPTVGEGVKWWLRS